MAVLSNTNFRRLGYIHKCPQVWPSMNPENFGSEVFQDLETLSYTYQAILEGIWLKFEC